MRRWLTILVAAAGMQAPAWTVSVPTMPVSPFVDTEVLTNLPVNRAGISYADLKFCFAGTPANNLELAFGTDVNTNGVLDAEEVESRFGWRSGRYFIENVKTWERFDGGDAAMGSTQTFSVQIHLEVRYNSRQVRSMNVSGVNAAEFGALATNAPPAWLWRRDWNLMRATRRGTEPPSDWIDYKGSYRGFAVKLR
ncbi:MAG: hypothetical protein ACI4RD_09665 [Kiritimatiellia bacterium]